MAENIPEAFYTLKLPIKPRDGDLIRIQAKLKESPNKFRLILGVKTVEEHNSNIEPNWVALEFKAIFTTDVIKVTTNWKIDLGWQEEEGVVNSDWIDEKQNVDFIIRLDSNAILMTDSGNSHITRFPMKFDMEKIDRVQVWGDVEQMLEVALKYKLR